MSGRSDVTGNATLGMDLAMNPRSALRPARTLALVGLMLGAASFAGSALAQAADSPSTASIKNLQSGATKETPKDAPAGTPARELAGGAKPAAAPKDAAVSAATPRVRRPVLRCWQEGKLVFEGSGVTPSSQGQAAIELRNSNGTALQVFDLRNGLCLLDHGND